MEINKYTLIKEINNLYKEIGYKNYIYNIDDLYSGLDYRLFEKEYVREIIDYYSAKGLETVSPLTHMLINQATGVKTKYFLPEELRDKVFNFLNEPIMEKTYTDKNMYPMIVKTDRQPQNIIRVVDGKFFSNDNRVNNPDRAFNLLAEGVNYIVKTSRSANGKFIGTCFRKGRSIIIRNSKLTFEEFTGLYGRNFIIQEKMKQSEIVKQIHPNSLNTLRLRTLRWNNDIYYLNGFLRIGVGGSIKDNMTTGGICIGIKDDGKLKDFAIDKYARLHFKHPTTGFDIKNNNITIPNFEVFKKFVTDLHSDVLHHDFVSWDIVVDQDNKPTFLEHNFKGTFYVPQILSGKPLFNEFTEEIVSELIHFKRRERPDKRTKRKIYTPKKVFIRLFMGLLKKITPKKYQPEIRLMIFNLVNELRSG
jgi:hypothetical protein